MSETEEFGAEFVQKYSDLMLGVWSSDEELASLLADPTGYTTAKGLPVAPGARVEVDRTQPEGLFHKDELVADWTATPGVHILHVPASSLVELAELNEAELDSVSAGSNNNIIVIIL